MASSEVLFGMTSSTMFSEKSPPPFNRSKDDYTRWKTKFQLWREITEVVKTKQAPLMVLRLDDVTQEDIMDLMTLTQMKEEDGVDILLDHLDKMFKNDEAVIAYDLYEKFVLYQRQPEMSVKDYCAEFQRRYSKVTSSGTQLSDHVLAHKLLNSATLTDRETQLIKATISEMTYNNMLVQLQKVFNSDASQMTYRESKQSEVFYRGIQGGLYGNSGYELRCSNSIQQSPKKQDGKNPKDIYGKVSRCRICDSVNHWQNYCPDRFLPELDNSDVEYTDHIHLNKTINSDCIVPNHTESFSLSDSEETCIHFQPDADDKNYTYSAQSDAEINTDKAEAGSDHCNESELSSDSEATQASDTIATKLSKKPSHRHKNSRGKSKKIEQKVNYSKKKRFENKLMRCKNEVYCGRRKGNKKVRIRSTRQRVKKVTELLKECVNTNRFREGKDGRSQRSQSWKRRKTKHTYQCY
jgi:hypothetical protein